MSANLVTQILQAIAPEIVGRLASSLGLRAGDVQQALSGSIPAILAALVGVAAKPEGSRKIADAIGQLADANPLKAAGTMNQQTVADEGINVLSSLLSPTSLKSLTNAIAKFNGIGESSATSLVGLAAPLVMNGIKQQAGGLDGSKIANLLLSQKDAIAAALPSGLAGMLSNSQVLSNFEKLGSSAAPKTDRRVKSSRFGLRGTEERGEARSGMNWLAWVLPLALLLGGMWYFMGNQRDHQPPTPTAQTTSPTAEQSTATGAIPDPRAEVATVVDSLRTTLQGITDSASAKAALPRLQEADSVLSSVTDRVAALPSDQKKAVAQPVATSITALNELIDKVLAIPGVAEIAKPLIDPIRTKLEAIAKL